MGTVWGRLGDRVDRLRAAFTDLLAQEFDWSTGHLATLVSGCVFAPSLFTFWFVNGLLDFSTALLVGSVGTPGGLVVRLVAYVLLVPTFLLLRASFYLAHPGHRQTIMQGACPTSEHLSVDWFSVGILATGLPLALQDIGPWLGMNAVFLVGVFLLPRVLPSRPARLTKLMAIALGSVVFLYANYGGLLVDVVPVLPAPAAVLGPVATVRLSDATTARLLAVSNSLSTGPVAVAVLAFVMNRLLTRPELTSIPALRHTLPRRDPARVVLPSAAIGTVFYLLVVAAFTGHLSVLPL